MAQTNKIHEFMKSKITQGVQTRDQRSTRHSIIKNLVPPAPHQQSSKDPTKKVDVIFMFQSPVSQRSGSPEQSVAFNQIRVDTSNLNSQEFTPMVEDPIKSKSNRS